MLRQRVNELIKHKEYVTYHRHLMDCYDMVERLKESKTRSFILTKLKGLIEKEGANYAK